MRLYLDDGRGPAVVRVAVARHGPSGDDAARGGTATVLVTHDPGDCLEATTVEAGWPDGTVVEVGVPTCLSAHAPTRPALTPDEAIRLATDPRWGVTMDAGLVAAAADRFPRVPVAAE